MSSIRYPSEYYNDYGYTYPSYNYGVPEVAPQPQPVCYFFGKYPDCMNINPQFCSLCGKFLCDTCRQDYDRRIKGMLSETGHWVKERILGQR